MTYKYNKNLYPKSALIKSAYHFTDSAYIHLACDEDYYIVSIELKDENIIDEKSFENEMLAQTARYEIFQQTKNIREISLARALASSVI
jgi:His-Xaa-Ser system protein HxsD